MQRKLPPMAKRNNRKAMMDNLNTLVAIVQYKSTLHREIQVQQQIRIQSHSIVPLTRECQIWSCNLCKSFQKNETHKKYFFRHVVAIRIDVWLSPWLHHNGKAPHRHIMTGHNASTNGTFPSWSENARIWKKGGWWNAKLEFHWARTNCMARTNNSRPQQGRNYQMLPRLS